ncbi:MAG: asparagine--tRNA ligase [Myxococcales bacterium FL481]|nr:MAG: asparagine--tRNA ligase [Myxococcales bacterium FL481]
MQTPRIKIVDALRRDPSPDVRVKGWLRTVRASKGVAFLELHDGSCFASLQVVVPDDSPAAEVARAVTTGSAVAVEGDLVESPAKGQRVELSANKLTVLGLADTTFPLQKKRHSFEYLRTIAHLRVRSNTYGAVLRTRSTLAQGIHRFFRERGFFYVHTPIITASDCEGAGEMFRVTTLDADKPARRPDGGVDWERDFFSRETLLTVSGQLNAEALALGLSEVYTFGPTFRAENSNTTRHAAEFWMIEPEVAWADLQDNADLCEAFVKSCLTTALEECAEDLAFFDQRIDKGLIARLQRVVSAPFERITYAEAVALLEKSGRKFDFPVEHGANLQAEHERYLCEEAIGRPTFVFDYPKEIKAFYMRRNDDGRTVAAMDLLLPKIGELCGGSQREERLDELQNAIVETGAELADYEWYLDLRRFGTAPHAGFGAGFERLVMYVTGMENIRDVSAFPRTPRNCAF